MESKHGLGDFLRSFELVLPVALTSYVACNGECLPGTLLHSTVFQNNAAEVVRDRHAVG
jgi:hypothetical protein